MLICEEKYANSELDKIDYLRICMPSLHGTIWYGSHLSIASATFIVRKLSIRIHRHRQDEWSGGPIRSNCESFLLRLCFWHIYMNKTNSSFIKIMFAYTILAYMLWNYWNSFIHILLTKQLGNQVIFIT
jgi:hypothetical protein